MEYRELLKEATRLKKERRYDEACQILRIAYQSSGVGEMVLIQERLRLPMYLLLADKSDEGWAELNRLSGEYDDLYNQIPIRNQMRIFSEKEGRWSDAIFYAACAFTMSLKKDIALIKSIHHQADIDANEQPLLIEGESGGVFELDFRKIYTGVIPAAHTESGSPIFDVAHNHILESLNKNLNIDNIESQFEPLCDKLGRPDLVPAVAEKIIEIIENFDETGVWISDLHHFFRRQLMD